MEALLKSSEWSFFNEEEADVGAFQMDYKQEVAFRFELVFPKSQIKDIFPYIFDFQKLTQWRRNVKCFEVIENFGGNDLRVIKEVV